MTVFIGGKERPVLVNSNMTLELYTQHIDINATSSEVYATVYASLYAADYRERQGKGEGTITFVEVMEWVDEAENEVIKTICDAFTETKKYKDFLAAFNDKLRSMAGGDKKKAPIKKA